MITLRQAVKETILATAQVERLRCALIKGAARVRVSMRRVLVELAAFCPFAQGLKLIAQRLSLPRPFQGTQAHCPTIVATETIPIEVTISGYE